MSEHVFYSLILASCEYAARLDKLYQPRNCHSGPVKILNLVLKDIEKVIGEISDEDYKTILEMWEERFKKL